MPANLNRKPIGVTDVIVFDLAGEVLTECDVPELVSLGRYACAWLARFFAAPAEPRLRSAA